MDKIVIVPYCKKKVSDRGIVRKVYEFDDYVRREIEKISNEDMWVIQPFSGVVRFDETIDYEYCNMSTWSRVKFDKWCSVVSEQVYRLCVEYAVCRVVMYARPSYFKELSKRLQLRGVRVETPIMGIRR